MMYDKQACVRQLMGGRNSRICHYTSLGTYPKGVKARAYPRYFVRGLSEKGVELISDIFWERGLEIFSYSISRAIWSSNNGVLCTASTIITATLAMEQPDSYYA
jgi:hypothetical protein